MEQPLQLATPDHRIDEIELLFRRTMELNGLELLQVKVPLQIQIMHQLMSWKKQVRMEPSQVCESLILSNSTTFFNESTYVEL